MNALPFLVFQFLFYKMSNAWQNAQNDINLHDVVVSPAVCQQYEVHDIESSRRVEDMFRAFDSNTRLVLARQFWLLQCDNVTLNTNNCFTASLTRDSCDGDCVHIEAPSFLANDLRFPCAFQHEIINGLAMLGTAWSWLRMNRDVAIYAPQSIRDIVVSNDMNRTVYSFAVHGKVHFSRLYIAAVLYRGEDGKPDHEWASWDSYGASAYRELTENFKFSLGLRPSSIENRSTVLYLHRPPGHRHLFPHRCLENCNCSSCNFGDLTRVLRLAVSSIGLDFEIFEHKSRDVDITRMHRARAVIGPHGGAFSNILWMQPGSTVVEINRHERLCFAAMSAEADLRYRRYEANVWRGYENSMEVDVDNFARFVVDAIIGMPLKANQSPCRLFSR